MTIEHPSPDGRALPLQPVRSAAIAPRRSLRYGLCGAGAALLGRPRRTGGRRQAGQGQVGHPDLAGRRAVAPGLVRPEAGRGQRLLRAAEQPDCHQRGRHPHRRVAPVAGQAGRQVLAHPQHDPRRQRPRDGGLSDADRPAARRSAGLSRAPAPWSRCSRATRPDTRG